MIYILLINTISFFMMGIDKYKSIRNKWRISEKAFILLSLLGGSLGVILGMVLFRHKTLKTKFNVFIPFIFVVQVFLYLWYN